MYNKTTMFLQIHYTPSLVSSMRVMMVCIQSPGKMCRSSDQGCGAVPLVGNAFPWKNQDGLLILPEQKKLLMDVLDNQSPANDNTISISIY